MENICFEALALPEGLGIAGPIKLPQKTQHIDVRTSKHDWKTFIKRNPSTQAHHLDFAIVIRDVGRFVGIVAFNLCI